MQLIVSKLDCFTAFPLTKQVVLNHEEGGERSVEFGDKHAETVLHEFGSQVGMMSTDTV